MGDVTEQILIVDDDPSLLKLMSKFLERAGYQVTASRATEEAWFLMKDCPSKFDAAVLDGTMSGASMSMKDLAVKMLEANPALRVVVTSGYPTDLSDLEAVAPGRAAFVLKPFTPEMLISALKRMRTGG
jgi:two-component system, cell cycle sensor histidine kinase and response regulator CckA